MKKGLRRDVVGFMDFVSVFRSDRVSNESDGPSKQRPRLSLIVSLSMFEQIIETGVGFDFACIDMCVYMCVSSASGRASHPECSAHAPRPGCHVQHGLSICTSLSHAPQAGASRS